VADESSFCNLGNIMPLRVRNRRRGADPPKKVSEGLSRFHSASTANRVSEPSAPGMAITIAVLEYGGEIMVAH